jgi:hypothetical protein
VQVEDENSHLHDDDSTCRRGPSEQAARHHCGNNAPDCILPSRHEVATDERDPR